METPDISVIIITKDEERDLPACLESLKGLEAEVVVLDNHSSDATVEVARRYTPHVHGRTFTDYASQKQAALELSTRRWVLSIDADERLSPGLVGEIRGALGAAPKSAGFVIPFEVHFLERALRHGAPGREKHLRLFRRDAGRFVGGELHEGVEVRGPIGRLRSPIEHHPYRDLDEYIEKFNRYTTLAAGKRLAAGSRFSALHHLLPVWELFVNLVWRRGLLDGTPGVVWAGLSSFHTWVKYVKLREMEAGKRP